MQPSHFQPLSDLTANPVSLSNHSFSPVFSLALFLSLFPSISILTLLFNDGQPRFLRSHAFISSPLQPAPSRLELLWLYLLILSSSLSLSIGYLFAIVPTFYGLRGYIGLLCPWPTRFPSNDKKHETDTRAACRTTEIPPLPPTPLLNETMILSDNSG